MATSVPVATQKPRLGRRAAVVTPQSHSMNDAVAIMTGAAIAA
jgi:fructose transport system ATP-binding protein